MHSAGAGARMAIAYQELRPETRETTLEPFVRRGTVDDKTEKSIVGLIERPGVGKGRFAQRLSAMIAATDVPSHVSVAIEAIVARCSHAGH
jgi:hypothetical protein